MGLVTTPIFLAFFAVCSFSLYGPSNDAKNPTPEYRPATLSALPTARVRRAQSEAGPSALNPGSPCAGASFLLPEPRCPESRQTRRPLARWSWMSVFKGPPRSWARRRCSGTGSWDGLSGAGGDTGSFLSSDTTVPVLDSDSALRAPGACACLWPGPFLLPSQEQSRPHSKGVRGAWRWSAAPCGSHSPLPTDCHWSRRSHTSALPPMRPPGVRAPHGHNNTTPVIMPGLGQSSFLSEELPHAVAGSVWFFLMRKLRRREVR